MFAASAAVPDAVLAEFVSSVFNVLNVVLEDFANQAFDITLAESVNRALVIQGAVSIRFAADG